MNKRGFILRLVLLAALAGAIAWLAFHREILQSTTLEQQLREFGRWSPILFVLLYSLATVLFVPGSILTVAGGALFGPLWGTFVFQATIAAHESGGKPPRVGRKL